MIKIRLQRHGARHAPFYRMVVTPATTRRDGKFIEVLGTYDPQAHSRAEELKLKIDRIDHWLGVGAQPTDTAKSLIRQGRLSPEEWLERSEKQASKRLARAQKGKSIPEVEAKSTVGESPESDPEVKVEEKAPEGKKEEAAKKEPAKEEEASKKDTAKKAPSVPDPEVKVEEKAPEGKKEEAAKKEPAKEEEAPKKKSKKDTTSTDGENKVEEPKEG
jgi:small subunit ribosomal protein S16